MLTARSHLLLALALTTTACSSKEDSPATPGGGCDDIGLSDSSLPDSAPAVDTGVSEVPVVDTGLKEDTEGKDTAVAEVEVDGGPGCPTIKEGGDVCKAVPKFTGKQVVDGVGSEFCDIPATKLTFKTGVAWSRTNTPPPLSTKLLARIAWSAEGIHAHFHVDDDAIIATGSGRGPTDAVWWFIGGNTPFYGPYDGIVTDPGLMLVQFTPPSKVFGAPGFDNDIPASASFAYCTGGPVRPDKPKNYSCGAGNFFPLVTPAKSAVRLVPGGYEIEAFMPWIVLGRKSPPSSGTGIAADIALIATDDPSINLMEGNTLKSGLVVLANKKIPTGGIPVACGDDPNPACDDRTWCTPDLE